MTPESRPRLAGCARLRRDRRPAAPGTESHFLLRPEKGLRLNGPACDILEQCTGGPTVAEIVERLAAGYGSDARDRIAAEVLDFLRAMAARGWITDLQDARKGAA